jgi:polyhydroxyalkanoate synthesis regulator phasin
MSIPAAIVVLLLLLNPVAAILAWAAKLFWSREYAAAKDETIRAKEAQIETLRQQLQALQEMTPMRIREYFESMKLQLEEYNDHLKGKLSAAEAKYVELETQLKEARQSHADERRQRILQETLSKNIAATHQLRADLGEVSQAQQFLRDSIYKVSLKVLRDAYRSMSAFASDDTEGYKAIDWDKRSKPEQNQERANGDPAEQPE